MFCSVRNASNTEVKGVSGLSRSLFSWRSSSYGTCVRCSSSTQLQVETAQKQIPAGHLILVFLIDLVVMLQPDLCCSTCWTGCVCTSQTWTRERERCYRATAPPIISPTGTWYETHEPWPPEHLNAIIRVLTCVCVCVQVISLVLQGRTDEARQVLSRQASLRAESSSVFKRMDGLLQSMPMFNVRASVKNMLHFTPKSEEITWY